MIKAAKQTGIVGKQEKIEIQTPELPEGTEVEIIVLSKHGGMADGVFSLMG